MLENATRICEAKFGLLLRFDGEEFPTRGGDRDTTGAWRIPKGPRGPFQPVPGTTLLASCRRSWSVHTADYAADGGSWEPAG